jgi:hypothetical protein
MSNGIPSVRAPSSSQVEEIAGLSDPILRNLQITQCYSELSNALGARSGYGANWCTFATWASKQAGQTIRKEDLRRSLELLVQHSSATHPAAIEAAHEAQSIDATRSPGEIHTALIQTLDLRTAVDHASDAVGRGNKKVFEEIGYNFARFLSVFLEDSVADYDKLGRFCEALRPGDPPDGQRYLRQAFTRYYRAFFIEDTRQRAQMLLCANLEIGLHEQTRLQPEIAEALDAAFVDVNQFIRRLLTVSLPNSSWIAVFLWLIRGMLGRPTQFDQAVQAWLADIQLLMRQAITESMMTIHLPPNLIIRLGADLTASFPESLRQLVDPDLRALYAQITPAPDSLEKSGAEDWANLPERLHFIADLFRCYQESRALFDPPFTPQQEAALKSGHIPEGQL